MPAPSAATTTCGDSPGDDRDHAHQDRFVSHRPVLAAAPAGSPISPNLVGRVVASFALAAQADARDHRSRAHRELRQARLLYAMAATARPPHPLVTALPHAFYPESSWLRRHGAGFGGARAGGTPPRGPSTAGTCGTRRDFARRYLDSRSTDTLNLYDTGALADVSLAQAMRVVHGAGRLAVTRHDLTRNLRSPDHARGARTRATTRSRAAASDHQFDVNSHTFGLVATVVIHRLPHRYNLVRPVLNP